MVVKFECLNSITLFEFKEYKSRGSAKKNGAKYFWKWYNFSQFSVFVCFHLQWSMPLVCVSLILFIPCISGTTCNLLPDARFGVNECNDIQSKHTSLVVVTFQRPVATQLCHSWLNHSWSLSGNAFHVSSNSSNNNFGLSSSDQCTVLFLFLHFTHNLLVLHETEWLRIRRLKCSDGKKGLITAQSVLTWMNVSCHKVLSTI